MYVQISGMAFDETTLFRVAYVLEQAADWGERRPQGFIIRSSRFAPCAGEVVRWGKHFRRRWTE